MNRINQYKQFVTPLGGTIVITSFFLPWLQIGVRGDEITSGFGLAQNRVLLAIAFIASLVITCVSLYMIIRQTPWKAKVPILVGTGIGLAMLLPEYLNFVKTVHKIHFAANFGFWGAAAGFTVAAVGAFLTKTESEEPSKVSAEEEQLWSIVHIGGFFALICFFIPWDGIGDGIDFSGIDLAKWNPLITIALISSVVIVGVSFYMFTQGTLWKARVPVFVSIGIGIGVLLSHYINYFNTLNNVQKTGVEVSANTLEFGLWGSVLGFAVAAVGVCLMHTKNINKRVEVSTDMRAIQIPSEGKTVENL